MNVTPDPSMLAMAPPYWVPFLVALGMMLTFLCYIILQIFKQVMEPIRTTMERANNTLDKLNETNGRLVEKIAVLIDRERQPNDRRSGDR